ncbi:SET domain-containing protein [Candidatus Wolfebacteria bacterium]|nr:SET domain-containing protein [Candidatus Wolfebacteria bacterium]
MLLVKTKIGPSKIHGIGLFADEFIPKDTPTWEFTPGFDVILTEEDVSKLPPLARGAFLHYCYKDLDWNKYILCSDDGRFMNHADDPSTGYIPAISEWDIALRDIQLGEELTYNYIKEDGDYKRKFKVID